MPLTALASTVLSLGLAVAPATATVTPPSSYWRWPLPGTPVVARPFAPPPHPWSAGHRGVDLAALPDAVVLAAGAGVVSFAGYVGGVGVVAVLHPGGLRTTYEPVAPSVQAGTAVAAGTPLGRLLPGHGDCGPARWCLHWGLLRGSAYLDPLTLIHRGPVRLLPLTGGPVPLAHRLVPTAHGLVATAHGPVATAQPAAAVTATAALPAPSRGPLPARSSAGRSRAAAAGAATTTAAALAGWLARRRVSGALARVSPAGRRAWP